MDVIIKPVITEKSMQDAKLGKFTFVVAKAANKANIKINIEKSFSVNVIAITTAIIKGRSKRVGKKMTEKLLPFWKKAIVELKKDQKIALFDVAEK